MPPETPGTPAKLLPEIASEIVARDRAAKDRATLRNVTRMIGKRQYRKLRRTALEELNNRNQSDD